MKSIIVKAIGTAFLLLIVVLYGCKSKTQSTKINYTVDVKIDTVVKSYVSNILDYVGTIEENSSTGLSFSTMGTIEKIYFSEGDYVSAGKLLAQLNPASAQSLLSAAEATLKQAQDGYDRLKSVHDKGSLTEVQMVDIETKLQQAQSTYNIAKMNLGNCSLYAPVSGVVGKRMAEVGEYAIIGKSVLTILDINSVKVKISVPENEISSIASDWKSTITISTLNEKKFNGKRIVKSVMANSISHTYPVYIDLSNPKKELLPGMVCKVELTPFKKYQSVVIPIGIIQTMGDGRKFVWNEKGGIAKRTFITTGLAKGNLVEITSGLSAGDHIITEGYQKISEEDKINVK